jgi:hypothetical protein
MTRGSIIEYSEAVRQRYKAVNKKGKGRLLDEFIQVTGYNRKSAIRLLSMNSVQRLKKRRGRRRCYGNEVVDALRDIWEASDRLCSKRLHPFMGEIVRVMRQHGELLVNADLEAELCRMSASTIDRLLKPWKRFGGRRPLSTTRAGSMLKQAIAIRTFADWTDEGPGFLEVDLVAHCGESTEGFYLTTLSAVDIASGWSECMGVWGKGQEHVRGALHRVRQRLPFPLLGLDSDNGSEFINQSLYNYCRSEGITFTRARAYKKNDSCHVEQKNGNFVRRLVGYDRYSSHAALECLNMVYLCLHHYANFFQPTMKLIAKNRHGAKVHKVYDTAKTPYQRLLEADVLTQAEKAKLCATYRGLNPVKLLNELNGHLEKLWKLSDKRTGKNEVKSKPVSVTANYEATPAVR